MAINKNYRITYSNIITKIKGMKTINSSMIAEKTIVDYKVKRGGEKEAVYKLELNVKFWKEEIKNHPRGINVIIDEAHSVMNARRSASKANILITDWIALIRRVLGSSESGHGDLILISQLSNRIDIIAREMATQVRWHVCYYEKTCKKCGLYWSENSEMPEVAFQCFHCKSYDIKKHSHKIYVMHFPNMSAYTAYKEFGMKTYYSRYFVNDIERFFPLYDTLQWDNLFSDIYT